MIAKIEDLKKQIRNTECRLARLENERRCGNEAQEWLSAGPLAQGAGEIVEGVEGTIKQERELLDRLKKELVQLEGN